MTHKVWYLQSCLSHVTYTHRVPTNISAEFNDNMIMSTLIDCLDILSSTQLQMELLRGELHLLVILFADCQIRWKSVQQLCNVMQWVE